MVDVQQENYIQLLTHVEQIKKTLHLPYAIQVLAVSKYATIEQIKYLYTLGQRHFGESYWQQAKEKIATLQDANICWHFIGQLQKNKLKEIAVNFDWVHSVVKTSQLELLSSYRSGLAPLNVLIQIKFGDDASRYGAQPQALKDLVLAAQKLPNIQLQGLMVLPKPGNTEDFMQLATLRDQLQQDLKIALPVLSMGMTQDYPDAIKSGATWIRIGSKLFES